MTTLYLHQTHHALADFKAIYESLQNEASKHHDGLHLFPESYLCGYPLNDLCLNRNFLEKYLKLQHELDNFFGKQKPNQASFLVGGLDYVLAPGNIIEKIYNVIWHFRAGKKGEVLYRKRLLPNYDIFDEKKYFTNGHETKIWEFQDLKIGLTICEDMWPGTFHSEELDPILDLQKTCLEKKIALDLVVNLSASPFNIGKKEKRLARASEISKLLNAPFAYVNRIGAEDEILFDGMSFVMKGNDTLLECKSFAVDTKSIDLEKVKAKLPNDMAKSPSGNTWENLFKARLHTKTLTLKKLNADDCAEVFTALGFGLQDYAQKNKLQNFSVALSGGIDSALVLALIKLHLKPNQTVEAVFMPGHFSATLSYDLCLELTKNLGVPLKVMPIKFLHNNIKMQYKDVFGEDLTELADENIQSRLRGALIYTRSNAKNTMVLNTSNKSEIAVGYSTMYGDAVGALSLLGDLFKGEVYDLCHYINQNYNNVIPKILIERAPSAELRENQKDEDSLLPYPQLDALLEGICSGEFSTTELVKLGFSSIDVTKIYRLYENSEYKRRQFCPILKLKSKSFGFGHRIPISKHSLI